MSSTISVLGIVGDTAEPSVHEQIHELEHRDQVEVIRLAKDDLARHRIRVRTDKGTECAIALPRSEHLFDGAVLLLEQHRAIVVRAEPERWLAFGSGSIGAALELGYFAGNMHWPVRFESGELHVGAGPGREVILERLHHLLGRGDVSFLGDRT